MQKKGENFSKDEHSLKEEIFAALKHIEIIRLQSAHLLNKPEVQHRALQLLDVLDSKIHEISHLFKHISPNTNHSLQSLLFNVKAMRETIEDLKINPHKLELQQRFLREIDHIKEELNQLK